MTVRSRPFFCFSIVLAICTPAAWLYAQHPNQPQGFSPERSYQMGLGGIDQVDLYSGRLSLTLPIGPFTLFYNTNVWRYDSVVNNNQVEVVAHPDRMTTAGLGWHLGWGELYHWDHWYNPSETQQWLYVGQDGQRHYFYDRMHYDDAPDGDTNVHYTRDNSYLRLRKVSTWVYDIEFPDGSTRRFANAGSLSSQPFRLVKSWSTFASESDPDLEITYNVDDTLRTVTDRWGREHHVHLLKDTDTIDGFPVSWMIRVVDYVEVEGFEGVHNVYDFEYENRLVDVSCKDDSPSTSARIRVPHLTEVALPDGTSFTMLDGTEAAYNESCASGIDDLPGTLTRLNLPTGGSLRWTYQRYEFPPGDNSSVFNTSAGVATRQMVEWDGTVAGTWTYKTRNLGGTGLGGQLGSSDPEMRLDVVTPDGDCSRHFFNATYYVLPSQQKGWELGLPFTYTASSGGKYLSTEVYTSNDGTGLCAGTKLRSSYVRYRRDVLPGCVYDPNNPSSCPRQKAFYDSNRTVEATRVVYHDDGGKYADTEMSDFDGLGNFRQVVTTGNLWSTPNAERREAFTTYDRVAGTYGQAGYAPPSTTTPWLLGLASSSQVTEVDANGETVSRTEVDMDGTTGAVNCSRQLKSGASRSAQDLLTTFEYDSLGYVTEVKLWGSDLQSIPTTGAGCGDEPSKTDPLYWTSNTYQYGVLETSRPRRPDGTFGDFLTYDVDLDPATGLVIVSRDPAGYETTFDYDTVGRLAEIIPEDAATTTMTYTNAGSTTPAKVTSTVSDPGASVTFGASETVFDSFGRAVLSRVQLPDTTWTEQETVLNARGWVLSRSHWGDLGKKTQFLNHDPFGRATIVRPADGSAHDVILSYAGSRQTTITTKVQKSLVGAESDRTKIVEVDRYGRLRRVQEEVGASRAADFPTVYKYDVGDRLTQIDQGPAAGPQQVRKMQYDNRGFLIQEQVPEKGASGNGWVYYDDYDPLGNASRVLDGPNDLGFSYDYLGRLTTVFDRNESNRPITEIVYDAHPDSGTNPALDTGFSDGKVRKATRYNYLDLPWIGGTEEVAEVEHSYSYFGVGGAVSKKETLYTWPDGTDTFRQSYSYDKAGQLTTLDYPRCTQAPCAATAAGTNRSVSYTYSRGLVTSVPGWVSLVSYHNDRTWSQVAHTNGTTDSRTRDPNVLPRVRRLKTTGPGGAPIYYDSGVMTYDGSGNIKALGGDKFAYDAVNRLVEASFPGWNVSQNYAYDSFGNLLERSTADNGYTTAELFPTSASTNRRTSGVTYDAAGNVASQQVGFTTYQFTYDTQNNLTSQAHMRYIYDANDERAGAIVNTPDRNMRFDLRDLGGRLLSALAYDNATYKEKGDSLYLGSRLLAFSFRSGCEHRYHVDHLGTPRLLTTSSGNVMKELFSLPYGEEYPMVQTDDNRKIGGHERDFSTGTDYMHARHYYSESARFLSVDSFRGHPGEPQSLNRYAYVTGNPIRYMDPFGFVRGEGEKDVNNELPEGAATFEEVITVTASGGLVPTWSFWAFRDPRGFFSSTGSGGGLSLRSGTVGGLRDFGGLPPEELGVSDARSYIDPNLAGFGEWFFGTSVETAEGFEDESGAGKALILTKAGGTALLNALAFVSGARAGQALVWAEGGAVVFNGGSHLAGRSFLQGFGAGVGAEGIGARVLLQRYGLRGLNTPAWNTSMQNGFNVAMMARGAVFHSPVVLPGGAFTYVELASYSTGRLFTSATLGGYSSNNR